MQVSRELALDSLVRDTKMRFVISVPAEASRAREQEGAAHRAAAAERGGDKGGWDGSTLPQLERMSAEGGETGKPQPQP